MKRSILFAAGFVTLLSAVLWLAAGAFYLLFITGIQLFVVEPGLRRGAIGWTLRRAAFFGLVTYATYDLTNYATLSGWPIRVVLVDITWGMVLTAAVASAGYLISTYFDLAP